jgi:hypothetical protein
MTPPYKTPIAMGLFAKSPIAYGAFYGAFGQHGK